MPRDRLTWVHQQLDEQAEVSPLAGDASFRSYHRVVWNQEKYVLMDAPPDKEDVQPFLKVQQWLHDIGLRVPQIIAKDIKQGFLLLEDFGDTTWAVFIQRNGLKDNLFQDALRQIHLLQQSQAIPSCPVFDVARMQQECQLYLDWYLPYIENQPSNHESTQAFMDALHPHFEALAALPKVPVHLDYHSRNLMLPQQQVPLGVIDFQDAVLGIPTYDLASLLYDCYQYYPEDIRKHWSQVFYQGLIPAMSQHFESFEEWHRLLRLSAMQRHFKALGIFARLSYRDGKKQFLTEIPLTLRHLKEEVHALGLQNPALLIPEPYQTQDPH
ncbi:MAG: phosphotransferase [Mariprofundaceae bacterium]|nr:phosphotransferase [Mariprofundaceae bacterium]